MSRVRPLLEIVCAIFPNWDNLTYRERVAALQEVFPAFQYRIIKRGSTQSLPGGEIAIPQRIRDAHISQHDVYTRVRDNRGFTTVFVRQSNRVGYSVDPFNPVIGGRGGSLHCMETLSVYDV